MSKTRAYAKRHLGRLPVFLFALSFMGLNIGCSGSGGEFPDTPVLDENKTGLIAFNQCDDLLTYFHDEAIFMIEHVAESNDFIEPGIALGGQAETDNAATNQGAEGGGPPMDLGAAPRFSTTNVQERAVDEPDLVKTDGDYIYTVAGGWLLIHNGDDLSEVSRTEVIGRDVQMLLDGDTVAIVGRHYGEPAEAFELAIDERRARNHKTVISVYNVANREAPALVRRSYVEGQLLTVRVVNHVLRAAVFFMGGSELNGLADHGRHGGSTAPSVSTTGVAVDSSEGPQTTDVETEPAEADSSEEDEDNMGIDRAAIEMDDEARAAEMERVIRSTTIDVWTPYRFEVVGDVHTIERVTTCGQVHRPGERSGLGVTALVSIDLNQAATIRQDAAVVTGPGVAYVSGNSLYLTTTNNGWWGQRGAVVTDGGDVAVRIGDTPEGNGSAGMASSSTDVPEEEADEDAFGTESSPLNRPREQFTQVHRLRIAETARAAQYVASGRVKGMPLNSFSLSEHNGHLRVATTETLFGSERERTNHVSVLAIEPVGNELPVTGAVEDIADGERIYATRFVGDKGFVVTFRQVDPLFTLDLSDPTSPQLIGELKVPGFSTYLHPFESDFLMGIGQSATDEGRITGMQLSLFDVSNFASPQLAATHDLGQGSSEALYDHHAFTFWAPTSTLMIPVSTYREDGDRTGLEVFSVDSESGFGALGFIDHASIDEEEQRDPIRRALVIGNRVITVGHRGLAATNMETLEGLTHTAFPDARQQDDRDRPGIIGPPERGEDVPALPEEAPEPDQGQPEEEESDEDQPATPSGGPEEG